MVANALRVFIAGKDAGSVYQAADGSLTFAYRSEYRSTPLSLSMPLSERAFDDKTVRPFLFGVLPDSYEVLADHSTLPGIDELGSRLYLLVVELCERSLARLG